MLVVDGGSTDGTREIAEGRGLARPRGRQSGRHRGRGDEPWHQGSQRRHHLSRRRAHAVRARLRDAGASRCCVETGRRQRRWSDAAARHHELRPRGGRGDVVATRRRSGPVPLLAAARGRRHRLPRVLAPGDARGARRVRRDRPPVGRRGSRAQPADPSAGRPDRARPGDPLDVLPPRHAGRARPPVLQLRDRQGVDAREAPAAPVVAAARAGGARRGVGRRPPRAVGAAGGSRSPRCTRRCARRPRSRSRPIPASRRTGRSRSSEICHWTLRRRLLGRPLPQLFAAGLRCPAARSRCRSR